MRILFISPFPIYPTYSGASVRNLAILEYLKEKHNIFFIYNDYSPIKDKKSKKTEKNTYPILAITRFSQLFNLFLLIKALKIIKEEDIDLIVGEYLWSGIYLIILSILTKKPCVFDNHNVEYKLVRYNYTFFGFLLSPIIKLYERFICKMSSLILCVSDLNKDDISYLGINKENILVINNGVSTKKLSFVFRSKVRADLGLKKDEKMILFFGRMDYVPNKEAAESIYSEILPRVVKQNKNIKFLIIGAKELYSQHINLILMNLMEQEELFKYINASDLVIVPLLHGSGTRLKILESIACGKYVISTSKGAEGLTCKETKDHLIIEDDWDSFADRIVEYINKKPKPPSKEFIKKFSWEEILPHLDKKITDLVQKRA